jgi:hypothetical protein
VRRPVPRGRRSVPYTRRPVPRTHRSAVRHPPANTEPPWLAVPLVPCPNHCALPPCLAIVPLAGCRSRRALTTAPPPPPRRDPCAATTAPPLRRATTGASGQPEFPADGHPRTASSIPTGGRCTVSDRCRFVGRRGRAGRRPR